MDENDIEDVEDFIGKGLISIIEVVSSNKKEDIQVVDANKFSDLLLNKYIVEDELNEGLQILLALSVDNLDILMIRKIRKWVKDFKRVRFFKYFGTDFREEDTVISDGEDEEAPVNFEDALRRNILIKAPIAELKNKRIQKNQK